MAGDVTLDRITAIELLDCLLEHERYHAACDAMDQIRHCQPVTPAAPLLRETMRLRAELERAIA